MEEVELLVREVLRTFARPYNEDITEDVFVAIERNIDWKRQYDDLCSDLEQGVVNQQIGKSVKEITRMRPIRSVKARRSTLITSYTKLAP